MGAGDVLGMEPQIAALCQLEGDIFILIIVAAHINVVAVTGKEVVGLGLVLGPDLFLALGFPDEAEVRHFPADFPQIALAVREIQSGFDGAEVLQLPAGFGELLGDIFLGALQLVIFFKIALGVFLGALILP